MCGSADKLFSGLTFSLIIVSDRSYRGEREDRTGPALKKYLEERGGKVRETAVVPDEIDWLKKKLVSLCDQENSPEVILTAGGTGLGPRDVTPEATKKIIDREVPGLAEAMRQQSFRSTPAAILSRAVAGTRKKTLIINLPGSPKGARENLEVIAASLPHAVEILRSKITDCAESAIKSGWYQPKESREPKKKNSKNS